MPDAPARHPGDTFDRSAVRGTLERAPVQVVTIVGHPDLARVGEHHVLPARGACAIARLEPTFEASDGTARPLDDPFLSRRAVVAEARADGGLELRSPDGAPARVFTRAGSPLGALGPSPVSLSAAQLDAGVLLELGERVLLGLERRAGPPGPVEALGMVGRSAAIEALRSEVERRAAALPPVVLVRGPTGSGKELVARALHARGLRRARPWVVVNVAAIPPATAASALFGHVRGAFTGAEQASPGYFGRAEGGVLFLDEIGELSGEVQPLLLRALESREIQPVGAAAVQVVDVVVVAATDAGLEQAIEEGRFRAPLFHRLAAAVIEVPPLAARGLDAALLFARAILDADPPAVLREGTLEASPPLGTQVVRAVLAHAWPGNVRELRAAAGRVVDRVRAGEGVDARALGLGGGAPDPVQPVGTVAHGGPTDDQIRDALHAHDFHLARAAEALGISRTHLDQRVERGQLARKAKALEADEISAALAAAGHDVDAAARALQVSARGLRLRMGQLGLGR